jgi:hypothetical protein
MCSIGFVVPMSPGKAAMKAVTSSGSPFHQWFRERVRDVHDLDLTQQTSPLPTLLQDASF